MGVDQRRIYLVTSAIGGALAGLAACLLALQYDVHPFIGNTFGPVIFMICVLGGLGNMIGGFVASFIISQIIAIGGYYSNTELSYVLRLHVLHRADVRAAAGAVRAMTMRTHIGARRAAAVLIALPFVVPTYFLHLLIQILIWAFIYTAWSLMGRFGFVSFGHGAFMGVGAYVPALLWNYYGVTPWIGIPARRRGVGAAGGRDRLSVLPPQGRRPLFRAGDAGAQPGRAAFARCRARHHRRLARLHAECRRPFLVRAAISREGLFLRHRARAVAGRARGLAAGSIAASAARRSRRFPRTRTPPRRSASMCCARSCASPSSARR